MLEQGNIACRVAAILSDIQCKIALYVVMGFVLFVVLTVTACSDETADPDEGGIIGTGIILQGVVSESTFASNNVVDVKSSDGQVSQLSIDSSQRFSTAALSGTGPWVLGVRTSADFAVYGIAYSDGTRNINRFSDLSLRNWFARQSLDLDNEFSSSGQFTKLPSATEYAVSSSDLFQLIDPVLSSYNVTGEDTISANYLTDDQGVDSFLNRNSVLIENDVVKFVFTDPATRTQSITKSSLVLQSEFRDTGASGPTVPGGVRALGSANDEIILVWDPSTDDVAVLTYQIMRDGVTIATTPYPVYVDTGLSASQPFSYQIIAVDVAGNKSEASTPVLASPLLGADNVAPPAPFLVSELDASVSSIQIFWLLEQEVGDVVRFNVYRGTSVETIDTDAPPLLIVTGTLATDTVVQQSETYCYQIESVDASGNLSDLSEVLCVNTSDANDSVNGINVPLVEWVVPELDSLNCSQILSSDQVQRGNTVITQGCYSVPETLTIGAGATLTLTEGAVLKFGDKALLEVPENATLTANGTPEKPVVLTGEVPIPGFWGGIEFQGSRSSGNLLRGMVVQYAGGLVNGSAINVTTDVSRLRMEDTLVRFSANIGINFNWNEVIIDSFQGNRIAENEVAGFVSIRALSSLIGNSEYVDNINNVIAIANRSYTSEQLSIPDLGVPYRWNGVTIKRGSLTIDPGTEFVMVGGSIVDVEGSFTAVGTVEQPIMMNGRVIAPGSWDGLLLSGRGDKTIEHLSMKFAGAELQDTGAIEVVCTAEQAANLSIDNTDISDSQSWGIYVGGQGCVTEIGNNNIFVDNALGDIRLP